MRHHAEAKAGVRGATSLGARAEAINAITSAQEKIEAPASPRAGTTAARLPDADTMPPEIQQFCTNNVAAAGQVRVAWEAAKLKELEAKVRQRIAELEAKRAAYEDWLHRRDEALKKAEENVVAIYTKMRPDAAALQLAAMDDDMAAAVLAKLKPSNASAILNEMDPGRAAHLTAAMVGATPAADKNTSAADRKKT
jgi:flagellar motility protein MotE (MotC chaperone)